MDEMDLTNFNSTISSASEVELLKSLLAEKEAANATLEMALSTEKRKNTSLKKEYEDTLFGIAELNKANDLAWAKIEDDVRSQINREAEELTSAISLAETKLDDQKREEAELDDAKATLLESGIFRVPTPEDSTIDAELVDLMEENDQLLKDFELLTTAIADKERMISELKEKCARVDSELAEVKQLVADHQQITKENKVSYEELYEEKVNLECQLNQLPRKQVAAELDKKESLFHEVVDVTTDYASKYESLKNKYIKTKGILSRNNAEISRLKSESCKRKKDLVEFKNKRAELDKELKDHGSKRIQDLKDAIELMNQKIKESNERKLVVIRRDNLSVVNHYAVEVQKETDRAKEKIKNTLAYMIPFEKKLCQCDRDLMRAENDLKHLVEANSILEKEIKQYEDEKPSTSNGVESERKIRFAEDVKYFDGK